MKTTRKTGIVTAAFSSLLAASLLATPATALAAPEESPAASTYSSVDWNGVQLIQNDGHSVTVNGGTFSQVGQEVVVMNDAGAVVDRAPVARTVDGAFVSIEYSISPDGKTLSWRDGDGSPQVAPQARGTVPNACAIATGLGGAIAGAPWTAAAALGAGPVGWVMGAATAGTFWYAGTQC